MKLKTLVISSTLMVFAVCFATGAYFVAGGYKLYEDTFKHMAMEDAVRDVRQRPGYIKLEEMPRMYKDAVIATEDHRFYRHGGVDIIAIGRAIIKDIQAMSFVQGGSTITQQLAKNLFFDQEKVVERKIAEVFTAFALEKRYTKDEILELYLNTIYFGEGYSGIGEASLGYYGKAPGELTDDECTMLAGVPNAPNAYAPSKNPELASQRQAQVVALMVRHGMLCETKAHHILAEAR